VPLLKWMEQISVAAINSWRLKMRLGVSCWAIVFLLTTIQANAQKPTSRLTNQDVIDLVSLGFSDEVIIDKIHTTEGAEFETTVSALRVLKAAKVSDAVIRAMINAHSSGKSTAAAPSNPHKIEPASEIGVYALLNGVTTELQPEIVNWQTGGFVKTHATLFIVKGDVNGKIPGPRSAVQLSTSIDLIVRTPEGTSVTEYQLLHLHTKDNRREFRAVTGGVIHQSGGAVRDSLSFEPRKIAERTWGIRLDHLSNGEYGLLPPGISSASISASGKMYTFSVDEALHPQSLLAVSGNSEHADALVAPAPKEINVVHDGSIGASGTGNPEVRHDGIVLSTVVPGGPADQAGLKAGDAILAIGNRFLFTINELNEEIGHYKPGTRVAFRYRRYSTIYDGNLTIGMAATNP
jgi:PDZ domain